MQVTSVLLLSLFSITDITVGVPESSPPMAYYQEGCLVGFDIDLLSSIAEVNQWRLKFVPVSLSDRFVKLEDGTVDILAGGISVLSSREKLFDFSISYMDSGIGFAVKNKLKPSFLNTLLENKVIWKSLFILVIVISVCAHIIYILERKNNNIINMSYYPGIFDAAWYVWISLTTIGYGDMVAKSYKGKLCVALFTLIGLGIAANVIGELSSFKIAKSASSINSISDLSHKKIGIVKNTATEKIINLLPDSDFELYKSSSEMVCALCDGDIDIIAHDKPFLEHICKINCCMTLPFVLLKHNYSFMFRDNSPLIENTNFSLLTLSETGKTDAIKQKWF